MPRNRSEPAHERKVIGGAELDSMMERLTRPRRQPKAGDEHLLAKHTKIAPEDLEKQISRLYDQSIETKKRKMEKAARAETKDLPESKKLTEEELAESVTRQYTQALHSKQVNSEKLKRKFLYHPEPSQLTPRSKADAKALGSRLHDESRKHKDEEMQKLYEKYVYSTGPKKATISEEDMKACGDRLCTPRGGV